MSLVRLYWPELGRDLLVGEKPRSYFFMFTYITKADVFFLQVRCEEHVVLMVNHV